MNAAPQLLPAAQPSAQPSALETEVVHPSPAAAPAPALSIPEYITIAGFTAYAKLYPGDLIVYFDASGTVRHGVTAGNTILPTGATFTSIAAAKAAAEQLSAPAVTHGEIAAVTEAIEPDAKPQSPAPRKRKAAKAIERTRYMGNFAGQAKNHLRDVEGDVKEWIESAVNDLVKEFYPGGLPADQQRVLRRDMRYIVVSGFVTGVQACDPAYGLDMDAFRRCITEAHPTTRNMDT